MVERRMPLVETVVLNLLRDVMPGVTFTTWVPDVHYRSYPFINIRRLGGLPVDPETLDIPVIELTAYSRDGLVPTENLYMDARVSLFRAVRDQIVTPDGYLHSYFETMGPTQFDSPYEDSWRIQGLIQLGLRPPN